MHTIILDFLKKLRIILGDAFSGFRRNNDLGAASSLAFSATLALIPALFLLTFLLGSAIGSSAKALAKTQELLAQLLPAYSQEILREVRHISANLGAIGLVNALVMLWSVTPLVADMRISLGMIFRKKLDRPFLLEKLFDVALSLVFLLGLSAIAVAGVLFTLAERRGQVHFSFGWFGDMAPFLFVFAVVFSLYWVFSRRTHLGHLMIGALATSVLWFLMRPAFHLFLTYNPGYGFAFGSFKSLFVVIIWIYCSLVVFLIGAEIAASIGRKEAVFIKNLMEGKASVPSTVAERYIVRIEKGGTIFMEGDPGSEMFSVLKGSVGILKNNREIAVIPAGKYFGEMSFLLSAPRVAGAVALEDVELVAISNENISTLMNEFPEFILEMLREMAERLRETDRLVG